MAQLCREFGVSRKTGPFTSWRPHGDSYDLDSGLRRYLGSIRVPLPVLARQAVELEFGD